MDWITKARQLRPGVHDSWTTVPQRSDDVLVRMANLTEDPMTIRAGTVVANLDVAEMCETEELTMPRQRSEPNLELQQMVDNADSSVGRAERKQLTDLLTEFSEAFSMSENDLGWTNVVTHTIDTGDSKPVRQPLRRHLRRMMMQFRNMVRTC